MLSFVFNHENILFKIFIAISIIDYLTGVCVAIYNKTLSSAIGYKGIAKKIGVFGLLALSNLIDNELLNLSGVLYSACLFFYIANECISIIENASAMGIQIPDFLKNAIDNIKKKQ